MHQLCFIPESRKLIETIKLGKSFVQRSTYKYSNCCKGRNLREVFSIVSGFQSRQIMKLSNICDGITLHYGHKGKTILSKLHLT